MLYLLASAAFPELASLFLQLLKSRAEAPEKIVGNPHIALFLNNLIASFLCSYGGAVTCLVFLRLDDSFDPRLRLLRRLDRRLEMVRDERLRFYLALFMYPVLILFINGAVLGFLFGFFIPSPMEYLARLTPHLATELPAILLSGGIGIGIGERVLPRLNTDFRTELGEAVKSSLKLYAAVLALLAVSAYLEA